MLAKILGVLKQKQPVRQTASLEDVRLMAARAAQRAKVGSGVFGQVYEAAPGSVVKEISLENKQDMLNEINLQAKAAEFGLAPKVQETYLGPPRIGDRTVAVEPGPNPKMRGEIVMEDLRKNYIPLGTSTELYNSKLNPAQIKHAEVETYKQLSQLALNGIKLGDRHGQNIFIHKLTNRPIQIDFGLAEKIENPGQQAALIANHVQNGLKAAGLPEEASMLLGLVNEVGQFNNVTMQYDNPTEALNMAKQGLSRLQKIKPQDIERIKKIKDAQWEQDWAKLGLW